MNVIRRAALQTAAALALVTVASGVIRAQTTGAKIAYVNISALLQEAPGRAAAEATLQREGQSSDAQMQKMSDSLNKLVASYQKREASLTPAQRETQQKAIANIQTEFQGKALQLRQELAQRENELMAPLQEAVMKVLEDIRTEDGFSIILADNPQARVILAADKNLDITDRVVARLKTVAATTPAPGAKTAAPASAPAGVTRKP